MTMSKHAVLTAIGRQLDADYLPTLAKPLPRELEDLLAQLVAHEIRNEDLRNEDQRSDPAKVAIVDRVKD